jgi:hypothetical protein
MTTPSWPTKQDDMKAAMEIILRLGGEEQATPLMSAQGTGDGETMQFSPSPWLAELVRSLIKRHGEEKGMYILRLVLRELGLFKRDNA